MLFCCGDQLNVASLSGPTQQQQQQREAPRAPPALPPQERGHLREQLRAARRNPGNADLWPFRYGIDGCSPRSLTSCACEASLRGKTKLLCQTHSEAEHSTLFTTNKGDAKETLGVLLEWLSLDKRRAALYKEMIHVYLHPCSSGAPFNDA